MFMFTFSKPRWCPEHQRSWHHCNSASEIQLKWISVPSLSHHLLSLTWLCCCRSDCFSFSKVLIFKKLQSPPNKKTTQQKPDGNLKNSSYFYSVTFIPTPEIPTKFKIPDYLPGSRASQMPSCVKKLPQPQRCNQFKSYIMPNTEPFRNGYLDCYNYPKDKPVCSKKRKKMPTHWW